jgi:hypothetical protein
MTKYTIHVPLAGKYWISSIWASASPPAQYHLSFYNGASTVSTPSVTCNGMTASYHAWYKFSDFASVQLDSGVQVMQFQNESMHLNQDFIYIAADSGNFQTEAAKTSPKTVKTGAFDLSINQGTIHFTLPRAGKTSVALYDCLGRQSELIIDKFLSQAYDVSLDRRSLQAGIYFVQITNNGTLATARFQILK